MKKTLLFFIVFLVSQTNFVLAHEAYVTPHKPYVEAHSGYTTVSKRTVNASPANSNANVYSHVRPICRQSGAVLSGGVNFISRDIGTGEVKQVVQVAPPPAYVGRYYY